jgi:hypothetical protein
LLWLLKQKTETGEEKKQLWQSGNHPEEIRTEKFYKQKTQYIHHNPIKAGWVPHEEDYEWNSADYFYNKQTAVMLFSIMDNNKLLSINSLHRRASNQNSKCPVEHLE